MTQRFNARLPIVANVFVLLMTAAILLYFAVYGPFSETGHDQSPPRRAGGVTSQAARPAQLDPRDGVATIRDRAQFHRLSYRGRNVLMDRFLADLEFVKFTVDRATSDDPQMYFINTRTHRSHAQFAQAVGLPASSSFEFDEHQMKGVLVYRPQVKSPQGRQGLYTFEFEPVDQFSFEQVQLCFDLLKEKMPALSDDLGYYPRGDELLRRYYNEKSLYDESEIPVFLDENLRSVEAGFVPLNVGSSFGRLRLLTGDVLPGPHDVVICETLPNALPRVAGIITTVRQTPLSHVNLRAVQDQIPNAFIAGAATDKVIEPLIGQLVSFKVSTDKFKLAPATPEMVAAHFTGLRPDETQVPQRDLSVTSIRPLDDVSFYDAPSVGVKAANLAALRSIGFPEGTIPNGFAIPFYFYDEFMKHNGFDKFAEELLGDPSLADNRERLSERLAEFRSLVKRGKMPRWMTQALEEMHREFPEGVSLRCRSSTNNEDLPGFSGAGLYDSYTHHPHEGHISKSIRQVYASLWNLRAFEEREFYRVDHSATAMGVLVHPNYQGELANGVAVTRDVLYLTDTNYYVNVQLGENLVTNPNTASIPDELLIDAANPGQYQVMRSSNRTAVDERLLTPVHMNQMREYLGQIHAHFASLYGKSPNDSRFAMEIEFKITRAGNLAIKQARPWVFAEPRR